MITLITGAPGAGKTAALVQLLQQFAKEGRAIFVDGIPDLKLQHLPLEDPKRWHVDVPDGSIIVIDEVQRVWRPVANGATVTPDIANLETHRHKGIEFYLITQHPNLLHANVRRLVGRHIHLRDVGVLGRWWYEWPEATNPEAWRSAPIKTRYKLPRSTFGQYKSASLHVKPVRRIPPALVIACVAIVILGFLAKQVYGRIQESIQPVSKSAQTGLGVINKVTAAPPPPPPAPAAPEASTPVLVGCIRLASRCECIAHDGVSVEIDLKLCLQSAERSGTGVPYSMTVQKHHPPASRKPLQAAGVVKTSM